MANLASSVQRNELISAIAQAIKDEIDATPIEKVLVYLFDTADVQSFPFLADQFDVLGYKGWFLAKTEEQKRELIENSVSMHRKMGTEFSIIQAIKASGYFDAFITTDIGVFHDGEFFHDGTITHGSGSGSWATFSVLVDIGGDKGITPQETEILRGIINAYKNARSTLINIRYQSTMSEVAEMAEEDHLAIQISQFSESLDPYDDVECTIESSHIDDYSDMEDGGLSLKVYKFGNLIIDESL